MDSEQQTDSSTVSCKRAPSTGYPLPTTLLLMKKLILIAVVAAIAAVLYKVLTTEVPIDDA